MADFIDLKVGTGVGPVHLNRFRTVIEPTPGRAMPSGRDLAAGMPGFMDARTASVVVDAGHVWAGESTLLFRGVARVRPFAVLPIIPIPPGLLPVPDGWGIPVPAQIRDWMMPDIHTDSVGYAAPPKSDAFTVQTLKRLFKTGDDHTIEVLIETTVLGMLGSYLLTNPVTAGLAPMLLIPSVRKAIAGPLVDYAVDINQHHFLAGRRSFRMGTAADYGLPGSNWVFETAAVERYSHEVFRKTTDIVMGGAAATVTPVWLQMGARVASAYGRQVGPITHSSSEVANVALVAGDPAYRSIATLHADLLP
ncbi:hypothetical protein [Sphingomonas sp.]|uniref:hypothetical protein n=1 Tax=Sphingomonas sp. TaxID=28214 RepID=UPI003B0052A5